MKRLDTKNYNVLVMLSFISPSKKAKKKANSPLQPTYPCFGQDLGDSEGAGNLPTQRWWIMLKIQNAVLKFMDTYSSNGV